ncbi:hypothetical protein GIB67_020674 [Kingdonia uniflora]|uniref:DUF4216 domain-containing protein n=1 Tax=Kingdonia uniflora TaxID=39325 RepID=A0A7J7NKD6_9MAGN|nr:hypothetical protein GIB67_020674 [Kingdonia uniflora]
MRVVTTFISKAGDKNPINEEVTYYGIVKSILELDYKTFKKTVFCCDWVCIEEKSGCLVDSETNLIYVNLGKLQKNSKEDDEPFILTTQASQVFYCKDQSRPNEKWHVVLDSPKSGHSSTVWALSFDTTGEKMVTCSDDLTIKIWGSDSKLMQASGDDFAPW